MIAHGTRLSVARLPLARLTVTEHQPRYPERVLHYVRLLSDPAHATSDPGVIAVTPVGPEAPGFYRLLDGHHRYCAAVICGRESLLALIHEEPEEPEQEPEI